LPSFFFFLILVAFLVFIVVAEVVVLIVVVLVEVVVVEPETNATRGRGVGRADHDAASGTTGFGLSVLGGGYVDQKCRPHLEQTQN
jgi:hypothetical protein